MPYLTMIEATPRQSADALSALAGLFEQPILSPCDASPATFPHAYCDAKLTSQHGALPHFWAAFAIVSRLRHTRAPASGDTTAKISDELLPGLLLGLAGKSAYIRDIGKEDISRIATTPRFG